VLWAERVEGIMNRGAIIAEPDDPIVVVVDTMLESRLRSLPVVERRGDRSTLVGVVSRTDVLPCLMVEESDESP
jgi:CBS domain-containing protein